jgi:hypothetical protein
MKNIWLAVAALLFLSGVGMLEAGETYQAGLGVDESLNSRHSSGSRRLSRQPRVVSSGRERHRRFHYPRHRRSHRFHHPRHYRRRPLIIGSGISLSFGSDDFRVRLHAGHPGLRVVHRRHVVGHPGFFCRHGRRFCHVCVPPVIISDDFDTDDLFYDLDFGDDDDYDEFVLPRDFGSSFERSAPVKHEQASNRPIVVQTEAAPIYGTDFPSNLSPVFGGPGRVGKWFARGEHRFMAGRYDAAAEAFKRAADESPAESAPQMALALSYAGSGNYWAAGRALRRAARFAGGWQRLETAPADAFGSNRRYAHVREKAEVARRRDPQDDDVLFVLGFLHYMVGQREHAGIYIERAARIEELDYSAGKLREAIYAELPEE